MDLIFNGRGRLAIWPDGLSCDDMSDKSCFLVIGSSGFLGRQIVCFLQETGQHVIQTHLNNPLHPDSIRYDFFADDIGELVDLERVDFVIFAGMVEFEREEIVQSSMMRFAQTCQNKRVVYLSSDGIFDGSRGMYSEADLPEPVTLYGRNLAICEETLTAACANLCIVRPSYIYGFSKGVLDHRLAKTKSLLEKGEDVYLFDDMYKSPLGVKQIARGVIDFTYSAYTGVIHIAGERLSIYKFQRQAMLALGVDVSKLMPNQMPTDVDGFLPDTSLNSDLWQAQMRVKSTGIIDTLQSVL